ncbi:ATP-binding cassette sub-family A member 2-like [Ptychodera flava]|uniref:ATP-binding cassette sub-family A member 2-like n=1 Tax=Ptychodera flava TaxID=63121 RepID=UPI003969DFA4
MAKPLFVPYSNEAAMFPENLTQYGTGGVGSEDLIRSLHLPAGLGTSTLQSMTVNSTFGNSLGEEDPALFGRHYFDDIHLKYIPENLSASPLETANRQLSSDPQTNSAELTCRCNSDSTGVTCSGQSPSNLPSYQSASGEILQDLTNHNLTKYLLATNQRYRQNRLGALSFGNVRRFVPIDFVTKLNDSSPFRKLASRDAVVAWYSTESTQSRAVFVNVLNNAIFRATLAQSGHVNPSDFGITVVNEPIVTERDVLNRFIVGGTYLKISVLTLIGMSSISASVLIFLVEERASNAKRLQYISGVSPLVYWISNYTWDFLAHVLPIAGCIAIFLAFGVPVYSSVHNILPVVALFVMYSWCVIPLVYPITYAFNVPSTAYMVFFICHVIISYFPTISMLYVEHFAEAELALSIMQTFDSIFLVVPGYCLGHGIILLAFCDVTNAFYKEIGEFDKIQHPFQWDILSRMLVVMAIEGFLFFCIVLLYDYGIFTRFCRICTLKQSEPTHTDEAEDIDVVEERRRILTNTKADVVRLVNLTKIYKGKKSQKCIAVDGICLGVPKAQCFGLLGINGAGKTTLFQMLTGDQTATQGDAYIHGKSISKNLRGVYRHIGYCPQYDALYSKLTGREHLILYSRLCGVQSKQRKQVVDSMLEKMNLMQYADKQAGTYSGGNKRKLSTAISLIGNPTVLFMDEPTTGMDPKSKRFLWKLINDIAKSGTSVVFTSHSMEECESLCSRLAIMVNGRFKCLGSTQHLKSRFGDGYTITLVLNKTQPRLQQVTSSFKLAFPETVLKDSHLNMVQFELKSRTLVEIFTKLEEMKKTLNIEDYYVRQTTLDDIFINFAKCKNSTSVQGNTVEMNQMKCNTEPEQENLLEENIV